MPDRVGHDGDGVGHDGERDEAGWADRRGSPIDVGDDGTGAQTGPSHSFKDVSVRDGTRKRCSEGENRTITQSFGQKVA